MSSISQFAFLDLFAGIGGFHAALGALGGELALAVEKDPHAAATYKRNWGADPFPDVVDLARNRLDMVPSSDVLAGGFPCQPFSKSGRQLGMTEERGQVFDEMMKIIARHRPPLLVLENVRNLVGPRQRGTVWRHIVVSLRAAGYAVSEAPLIISPHRLPPHLGGAPQSRERVFILAAYVGEAKAERLSPALVDVPTVPDATWSPRDWDLDSGYLDGAVEGHRWSRDERQWLTVWGDFLRRTAAVSLPGHPLWADYWSDDAKVDSSAPPWKQRFEVGNLKFWSDNRSKIHAWQRANPQLKEFPVSRRKFEWQAGDSPRDIGRLLVHLRPSGIRVKKADYTPALVAMAQTPLIGKYERRMTTKEAARLQGFPDWFKFDHQGDRYTYKQLGNAVNVGVAYYVIRNFVRTHADLLRETGRGSRLVDVMSDSPQDPRIALAALNEG